MEYKDYYKIMEVSKDASAEDIKRSYRKLARKYHPDVSKEKDAERRFKEVNEAYEVLKDPEKRKAYDQLGAHWKLGQSFNPNDFDKGPFQGFYQQAGQAGSDFTGEQDFSDFFETLFGQQVGSGFQKRRTKTTRGEDLHVTIELELTEAYEGVTKTLSLRVPERAADGSYHETNKTLKVKIPPGALEGQQIRLSGQGVAGDHGGPPGDLYLKVHFKKHPWFRVEGKDIFLDVPIAPWEAALGASITVPTLAGSVQVKIAPGASSGQKLRLKARGLPAKEAGSQYLILQIQTPKATTEAQEKAYQTLAREWSSFNPRSHW